MKTPEEIKKGLEHCMLGKPCVDCSYDRRDFPHCVARLMEDADACINELVQRLAQTERERYAAVYDLISVRNCTTCKKFNSHKNCSFLIPCVYGGKKYFEWRGLCAQNTKDVGL